MPCLRVINVNREELKITLCLRNQTNKETRLLHAMLMSKVKPWCATVEDLVSAFKSSREDTFEERKPCHFTLRLLEQNGLMARDRFVELVAVNDSELSLAVAVREVLLDQQTGKREPYTIVEDGVIQEKSTELGYFVAGEGTGEKELLHGSWVLREPIEEQAFEYMTQPVDDSL